MSEKQLGLFGGAEASKTRKKGNKASLCFSEASLQQEFVGILQGIVADGEVNFREAEYLCSWLEKRGQLENVWLSRLWYARLKRILSDDKLDVIECQELIEAIRLEANAKAVVLPHPIPESVCYDSECTMPEGNHFLLTGTFRVGKRDYCERIIKQRGGLLGARKDDGYTLIVGSLGFAGREGFEPSGKLATAMRYRDEGAPVSIVSESTWWETVSEPFVF
ncbi:hypothetical protein N1030_01310 [Desulfovibrio mangrovi]|uniref:hypothetical protein n=1 Tax=Desulfovibrio mangrovi TaxID=2976983 RepID=UPI002246872F|nr:hypothetical protein [Desulfovibrio mangrovi]UZP67632.1 hypothetical protein N1030_01310 [Desulfovibrio mangrovi]